MKEEILNIPIAKKGHVYHLLDVYTEQKQMIKMPYRTFITIEIILFICTLEH